MKDSTLFLTGSRWRKCWPAATILAFLFVGSLALYAQDSWRGPQGASSWFTDLNWTAGSGELTTHLRPTPLQDAIVDNGTTAQIGLSGAVANSLTIGNTVAGSTVQMTGGVLTVGNNGTGIVTIGPGGTMRFSGGAVFTASFVNDGAIVFDVGGLQNLVSPVSGAGTLTMAGSGTLRVTSTNTFTGITTISAGTLQLGLGGTTGSITGDVLDNSVLAFDRSNAITFGGAISGAGSVTQIGTGTTILTGTNTYAGGTTISAGALQIGNGGTTGSITGNVLDNSGLVFDRSNAITFGGAISGVGSVTQIGTGTTILTGTNTYARGTTIRAGALQIGNGGTTGSIEGDVLDNSVLSFDRSNAITFGGAISGVGSVTQIGTGTTILTGNNTYAGGTTINAGTLQLGNGGTTGSIVGNVVDNGVLAFDRSDLVTFAGVISGRGIVSQEGSGTTVLLGSNTYTGGTTISAGTLQLGNGGTNGSITGNVANNGVLAFNRSDSVTFTGSISGSGSVVDLGPGVLILTGANTYTGGTTINAGTLQIGDGGTTGSIVGNVTDQSVLAFNRSDSIIFGGVISGEGRLLKTGAGTLTLPGINTYTGTTTIDNGSLIVDGSIASGQTFVNANGSLGGHGTIGGNVVNNGLVSQFNAPGTLTVLGDYRQNAGGTLRIGVGGLAPGQHDTLAVNGRLTLGGTLQLVRLGGFTLQPGKQITFLTAKKGVSGNFDFVQNEFLTGTIVEGTITALANALVLEGNQGSFAGTPGVATTPNQVAVAKALDSAVGDPRAAGLIAFLDSEPLGNLPHDLDLIAPSQISSIGATGVQLGKVQASNLEQRMTDIRQGSNGFSSSGFALSGGAGGFAGVPGPEGKSGPPVFAPTPENRWGVFVTGLGEFTNVDDTTNSAGYGIDTGGFTLGVDYRVTPNFAIGLTGGYAHTNVDLNKGGDIEVNGGKIGVYATIFKNGFYLDTAVSGGPSGYNTHRAALLGTANGDTDGADLNALVAGGYDWKIGNLTIGPTASFEYSYVGLDAFTETGSLAPLRISDQNFESERIALGAKASCDWKIGHITVIPQISAAWQHEFGSTEYAVVANFANGAGKSFSVNGPATGRDSLLVGAGATVILNERVSTYLFYDGEVARTNYESHNVTGGVRISF